MAGLADALNQMAAQLDRRINTIISQRNELETVLAGMLEGVIAVDNEEKIINSGFRRRWCSLDVSIQPPPRQDAGHVRIFGIAYLLYLDRPVEINYHYCNHFCNTLFLDTHQHRFHT